MIKKYTTIKVHLRHPSKCWRLSFFCGKVMCWTNQAFHSCGNSVWRIQVANDLVAYKDHTGPTPYSFNIHKYKYDMQKRKQRICRQHAWHADESGFHWRKQKNFQQDNTILMKESKYFLNKQHVFERSRAGGMVSLYVRLIGVLPGANWRMMKHTVRDTAPWFLTSFLLLHFHPDQTVVGSYHKRTDSIRFEYMDLC